MSQETLGKLQTVYHLSPVYTQRVFIIGGLSLIFFAAMLFAFSMRQSISYLMLALAFLFVEIVTLLSWVLQRRATVRVFENGFAYKKQTSSWDEIATSVLSKEKDFAGKQKIKLVIEKKSGEKIILSDVIANIEHFAQQIEVKTTVKNIST